MQLTFDLLLSSVRFPSKLENCGSTRQFGHAWQSGNILAGLIVLVLSICAATPASAQVGGAQGLLPSQRELSRHGLERLWWGRATMDPGRETVAYLSLDQDYLYVQSTGGLITSFDNETGKRMWSLLLGRRDAPSYPAVSNDREVLVVAGMKLYGVAKHTGELLWELTLPAQPSTKPAVDKTQVYVGSLEGSLYAFDLRRIQHHYDENLLPQWSGETVNWRYKTSREITTTPVSGGRIVNFASRDGSLYSVSTAQRELSWQFETDAPIAAPLGESNGYLFLASEDFNVYCINEQNGQVRWQMVTGFPVRTQPFIIENDVFITPDRGGFFSLTREHGEQNWWRPTPSRFLAATQNRIYTSDRVNNLLVLSRDDGALLGSLPYQHYKLRYSNELTDRIYMATQSGTIVCLRERGYEFPTYYKYPEDRPILPEFASPNDPPDAMADPATESGEASSDSGQANSDQ